MVAIIRSGYPSRSEFPPTSLCDGWPGGPTAGFRVYHERRDAPANSRYPLSREQFIWGLSNGTVFLAAAAAFWLGLAASAFGGGFLLLSLVPILIGSGSLVVWSRRLRRKARGFGRRALRNAPKGSSIRRIGTRFQIVSLTQGALISLTGFLCWFFHRLDLVWPLIGLIVAIHFLPLGWLFRVRPYYALGLVEAGIAIATLWGFTGVARLVTLGLALGLISLAAATYLLINGEGLADRAADSEAP